MQTAKTAVSRIEFRTNMMRGDAELLTLGYIVECLWDDARWMGMIFRPQLTPNEVKAIGDLGFETWPELRDPCAFLEELFVSACNADWGSAGFSLNSQFGSLSALHVALTQDAADFADGLSSVWDAGAQVELENRLRKSFDLQPSCSAKIHQLPPPVDHRSVVTAPSAHAA